MPPADLTVAPKREELRYVRHGAAADVVDLVALDAGGDELRADDVVEPDVRLLAVPPHDAGYRRDAGELVCHVMPRAAFDEIVERHQAIAVKLLTSLAQELGKRLRFTNDIIDHLQA